MQAECQLTFKLVKYTVNIWHFLMQWKDQGLYWLLTFPLTQSKLVNLTI